MYLKDLKQKNDKIPKARYANLIEIRQETCHLQNLD